MLQIPLPLIYKKVLFGGTVKTVCVFYAFAKTVTGVPFLIKNKLLCLQLRNFSKEARDSKLSLFAGIVNCLVCCVNKRKSTSKSEDCEAQRSVGDLLIHALSTCGKHKIHRYLVYDS